ncbi:hypothetical protein FRC08_010869 [Ceratobasidium sp. 394]|nr:hypothetical protein FRC08_010869 [Ceratobasidium sp. 394]KAG9099678.1 hypothetical protein FS749_000682 [Ceratobasidium sp. UAMH 11750]
MSETVAWKGSSFWHDINDRHGRFEKLQASLSRKNIFSPDTNVPTNAVQLGDIIPVPNIRVEELGLHAPSEDALSQETNSCPAFKTSAELLSLGACSVPSPAFPRSPLDQRIAELEASLGLDGSPRLAASPKILASLRPEPPLQTSLLTKETGITRMPCEITKRIISFIERRRDVSALSCVSKRWRAESMPALYSTLVLRGWDEVILCLRTVYSVNRLANYVNDLTIDVAQLPESLNDMFYSTLENALDKTRNLRRLALIMNCDRKTGLHLSRILGQCRFRLHHFVYEGPGYPDYLAEFLDLQTSIRTLQVPHMDSSSYLAPLHLPRFVTQLWLSFSARSSTFQVTYENTEHLSHLSFRGEPLLPLTRLGSSRIHYLAYDISPWISNTTMLPSMFRSLIAYTFSGLRILRLIGYWIICETPGATISAPLPEAHPIFGFPGPTEAGQSATEALNTSIGYHLDIESGNEVESTSLTPPTLYIEPGFLDMLSCLPSLRALEVGSFAVRDAGCLRTQPGHARYWLTQRIRWEDDFVHRVTSQAAPQLAILSFLACDEPLYCSCFNHPVSRQRWSNYIETVRKQIAQEDAVSGVTLAELISQAGLPRWSGCASEPDNKCDYRLNSGFVPSTWSRQLFEEVVTSEWVKVGAGGTWTRRDNVRNLRDIWPAGC